MKEGAVIKAGGLKVGKIRIGEISEIKVVTMEIEVMAEIMGETGLRET